MVLRGGSPVVADPEKVPGVHPHVLQDVLETRDRKTCTVEQGLYFFFMKKRVTQETHSLNGGPDEVKSTFQGFEVKKF